MKKLITIIAIILLVGCTQSTGECVIVHSDFIPMIKGEVEGKSFYFLIDTGASISIVDKNQLQHYFPNKRIGIEVESNVSGYGGTVNGLNELNFEVQSGTLKFKNGWNVKDITNIVQATRTRTGKHILGIIGNNNLKNLIIDLKNNRIYHEQLNNEK